MPLINGIHHVAVITGDLDRFVEFYSSVFDADIVDLAPTTDFRHALVRIGPATTLHTIEFNSDRPEEKPALMHSHGYLDHLALHAPSRPALREVRRRLMARGACDESVSDLGAMLSVWFRDPDGMRAEVCWNRDPSLSGLHAPMPLAEPL